MNQICRKLNLLIIPIRLASTFSKKDATKIILDAKKQTGYSFEDLAKKINVNKVNLNLMIIFFFLIKFYLGLVDIGHSWPTSNQQ